MALDNYSSNGEQKDPSVVPSTGGDLFQLLGSVNLISSTHNIMELNEIVKSLEDTVKFLKKNTGSAAQKLALPGFIRTLTADISQQLPGLTLHTIIGPTCYVMPVLLYKAGITDVNESIYLANEPMPRGTPKVASSFMSPDLMERVKSAFTYLDGKQMTSVLIVSPIVINMEAYIKNAVKQEDMINDIKTVIMKEWTTGLYNMVCLDGTKNGHTFPTLFKEGKLFGKDDAAVATITPVNKLTIDGRPTAYNLGVKLSTTNKTNTQNINSQNVRTIANTYMNVSLEPMSPQQFNQARAAKPGAPVGPLVPVISTGITIPGETLNNNNSILSSLLGLYASIGANRPQFYTEAFRGKEVGNRGNIGNFNFYLTNMLQGAFGTAQAITEKNINNIAIVTDWLTRYVAHQAVYVQDLSYFSEDVSNSDFYWNLVSKPNGSTYHRTLTKMADQLTGNAFSSKVAENAAKGTNREKGKDWIVGDPILKPTPIIMPTGIAQGRDGKWFDLGEVDSMFLRQDHYYGQNEAAISEYQALIGGGAAGDLKVRQFNITNRLQSLFSSNVIIDGWKRRFVWDDSFCNTLAASMSQVGMISMSSPTMASVWTMHVSNDYLMNVLTASIQNNMGGNNTGGFAGNYSHY